MQTSRVRALARSVVAAIAVLAMAGCSGVDDAHRAVGPTSSVTSEPDEARSAAATTAPAFDRLQQTYGATLGVFALDTGTRQTVAHNANRRFAYASTYKSLAAGVLLADPSTDLDAHVDLAQDEILAGSPVTSQHVESGMRLGDVVAAALEQSDNTAGNIVLQRVGGPAGFETALRRIGDTTTRSDRTEPDLNAAVPGDDRDTSTPRALALDLDRLVLGSVLHASERARLIGWMRANTTGDDLVRAAVPAGWTVADKTGTGYYGVRNDIAVVWPPSGAPIVLAIQTTKSTQAAEPSDALVAAAAKEAIGALR
ncbi:class A beta-lactamase [Curtobacterium sp. MCBD17_035]|uniref:class A beta-lactamase n=1 Tax=Curtobacterium sp. MCBD17_035 TaxID=2175673 RepID=UPI000DA72DA6|nr:class A beta-lactamase [Curtobacterium sp. MCBD17_035]WIB68144.1 class A beta-lactamase [Curtobacterium sp. MCBD17_035]